MFVEGGQSILAPSGRFVVTSIDRRFVEFAGVMLHTLALNGEVEDTTVVVFCDGLTAKDKERLKQCAGKLRVVIFDLTDGILEKFKGFKTNSNWSRSIYTRLILPSLLGLKEGRMVYLDADTIVVDRLGPLLDFDMAGMAVAALGTASAQDSSRLNLPDGTKIMNSGVLLIDVKAWLSRDLTNNCLDVVRSRADSLKFFDQDALNIVLAGEFASLDPRWNVMLRSCVDNPAVIHFTHDKPNSVRCQHAAQPLYLKYRQSTPWANKRLKSRWHKRINRVGYSIRKVFGL